VQSEYLQIPPGKRLLEQASSEATRMDGHESKEETEKSGHVPRSAAFEGSVPKQNFVLQKLRLTNQKSPQKSDVSPCKVQKVSHVRTPSTPYCCRYCEKAFTKKHNLLDHLRRHRNFRPFECSICGECHFTMQYANAHFRKKHPGEDPNLHIKRHSDPEALALEITSYQKRSRV